MQLGDIRTFRRQEAHRKAIELKHEFRYDEAISLMMHALQSYGPNILMLIDVAQLFKFQNEIGNYYYYGRKIEQEWLALENQISEKTKSDVTAFLGLYLYDRGQVSRSFYYLDLACKSAMTADQHIVSVANLLNLSAEFKMRRRIQDLYLECLKLNHLSAQHNYIVERALLKAEMEIVGFEHAFYRLEKYALKHGVVDSGFHSLIIDFLVKALLNRWDLSSIRDSLFELLNRVNPIELSTFEKIVIQFFDQPHYFLHAQEMSYLQQRFNQAEILDVYYLNYLACENEMTQKDLKSLFQLMVREADVSSQQLMKQKYFNEQPVVQKWRIYLNEKSLQLITLDGMLSLKKDEHDLLSVFTQEAPREATQLALQFQTQFELKELVMRLNQKIYTLTQVPDALTITTLEVKLLESIQIIRK